nr:DNA helicase [Tanacetum cinerariifolium]
MGGFSKSAELLDPQIDLRSYKVVLEMMIYGPCGTINMSATCMQRDKLSKAWFTTLPYFAMGGFSKSAELLDPQIDLRSYKVVLEMMIYGPCGTINMSATCMQRDKAILKVHTAHGIFHPTCRAACEALGLLGDDTEWDIAMQEACASATSSQLRSPPGIHIVRNRDYLEQLWQVIATFWATPPPQELLYMLANILLMEERNYNQEELQQQKAESVPRNGNCGTGSWSDNTIGNPHGFIIHWIVIFKDIKKVTEIIDVKNRSVNNFWLYRWFVSLFEWNSHVSSLKSLI